ncbi:ubiquinol-cytochrome C reductase hinge domain-containing protein [Entophlyctis helioformis]|nr:ubiquinol-cytochrome C reductase hinge domain-containing protein [Entophlyctis helioformis]
MSDKAGSEDPKPQIEAECIESHHCHSFKERLDACTERVEGGEAGEENCVEEFFDLMAAPKLFAKLV